MNKALYLLLILVVSSITLIAQNISGTISDKKTGQPVPGATIALFNTEGKMLKGTITGPAGKFDFKVPSKGNALLKISYVGYETVEKELSLSKSDTELGVIMLLPSQEELKEVVVKDKAPMAIQKGDTTEMNAGVYQVNPDANAQQLIEKMPGVEVKDNQVKAHGEDVKKVLVDGREFFGDDVNATLQNMPAEVIEKIQIFDKLSDQAEFTGINDGNTTKTMNIVTKGGMKNGTFGRIYGGYGTDDRYSAGGIVNNFKKSTRLSVLAQTNNVNQQNFSIADLVGISGGGGFHGMGGRGGMGGRVRGGDMGSFLVDNKNGITQTHAFGLNYSDKWGDKIQLSGSYFFNYSDNNNSQGIVRNYVSSSAEGQVYDENNSSSSTNVNHRFNLRFEYKIDSMNSISFRPRFTYQKNDGTSEMLGQTNLISEMLNKSFSGNNSNLEGLNTNNDLLFRHKFMRKGRTLSLGINGGYNENTGDNSLLSVSEYYTMLLTDSLDQRSYLDKSGWNWSSNISYTEPLSDQTYLGLEYRIGNQSSSSDKKTYNYNLLNSLYDRLDTALSNVFDSRYITHNAGASWILDHPIYKVTLRMNYQHSVLNNDEIFPEDPGIDKSYDALLPSANIRFNFSKTKNLSLNYRTSANSPSVDQLQDVINNSNPLQLTTGNPLLKQNYQHNLNARYFFNNMEKVKTLFIMLGGSYSDNYIGRTVYIADQDSILDGGIILGKGSQITSYSNLSGYYNIRSMISFGIPLPFLKSNLNMNVNSSYTQSPGLVNNSLNSSRQPAFGGGLVISSNFSKKFDFTISGGLDYTLVRNTLQEESDYNYLSLNNRFRLNWIIKEHFVLSTDLNHRKYEGLSADYNENYLLWNASMGYKFLKNNAAELKVSAFDILDQNKSITRTVTEYYNEDVRSSILQQYYMLTFTYTIRGYNKAPEGPPPGMPPFMHDRQ